MIKWQICEKLGFKCTPKWDLHIIIYQISVQLLILINSLLAFTFNLIMKQQREINVNSVIIFINLCFNSSNYVLSSSTESIKGEKLINSWVIIRNHYTQKNKKYFEKKKN